MNVNKFQLVKSIADDTGLTQKRSVQILDLLLNILIQTLSSGETIRIRGFGKFYIRHLAKRRIRHPETGKIMIVESRNMVGFKSSKVFERQINELFWYAEPANREILQQLYELVDNASDDYTENEEFDD
jgi:nucleoid DNA-binding protein